MITKKENVNSIIETNNTCANNEIEKDTVKSRKKITEKACKTTEKKEYQGFSLTNEYVESQEERKLVSSKIITNQNETIMESTTAIEVIELNDEIYLINSINQTIVIEVVNDEAEIIINVSRTTAAATYKITDFLKNNRVVILTDYNNDEKRNFEYLYDYTTGKRISSGFDSIDEVDGKLKVTYGLATGNLDLDGTFTMEPDEEYIPPKGFFARLFK